jgi:uncharacterized protein
MDYWMIHTQDGTDGGLMKRQHHDHKITDYFGVPSLRESSAEVEKLDGKILMSRMAVPKIGYFAAYMDNREQCLRLL